MSGWEFGGWPPPPPSEAGGVSFAAVKAALALADSAVGFNGQRLSGVGAPVAGGDAVNADTLAALVRSFANFVPTVQVVAPAATVTISGPAAGFLRVFGDITALSNGATPAVNVTLLPGPFVLGRAISLGAATAASQTMGFGTPVVIIGPGESLTFENVGTASFNLWSTYVDVPSANRTLVRATFSNTPVVIVPAVSSGSYRKLLGVTCQFPNGVVGSTPKPAALLFNDDTATIQIVAYYGGTPIIRSSAGGPANASAASGGLGLDMTVTASALALSTVAAVATRPVVALACYETFLGTP